MHVEKEDEFGTKNVHQTKCNAMLQIPPDRAALKPQSEGAAADVLQLQVEWQRVPVSTTPGVCQLQRPLLKVLSDTAVTPRLQGLQLPQATTAKSPGGTRIGWPRRLGRACHESKITPAPSTGRKPPAVWRHHVNRPHVDPFPDQKHLRSSLLNSRGEATSPRSPAARPHSSTRPVARTWQRGCSSAGKSAVPSASGSPSPTLRSEATWLLRPRCPRPAAPPPPETKPSTPPRLPPTQPRKQGHRGVPAERAAASYQLTVMRGSRRRAWTWRRGAAGVPQGPGSR